MTVKQRILTIRLMKKAKQDPEHAKNLGLVIIHDEKKVKKKEGYQ